MFMFNKLYKPSSLYPDNLTIVNERLSWTASYHYLEKQISQSVLLGWHTHQELDVLSDRDTNYWLYDPYNLASEPTEDRLLAVYCRQNEELLAVAPTYDVRRLSPDAIRESRFPGSWNDYQLLNGFMTGCVRCYQHECSDVRKCFPEAFVPQSELIFPSDVSLPDFSEPLSTPRS